MRRAPEVMMRLSESWIKSVMDAAMVVGSNRGALLLMAVDVIEEIRVMKSRGVVSSVMEPVSCV